MYTRLYKHTHTNTNRHTLCFGTRIYCVYVAYSLRRCLNTPMFKYRTLRTQCSNWKVFSKRLRYGPHTCASQPANIAELRAKKILRKLFWISMWLSGPEEFSFWAISMKSSYALALWVFRKWLRAVSPDVLIRVFIFVCSHAGSTCL